MDNLVPQTLVSRLLIVLLLLCPSGLLAETFGTDTDTTTYTPTSNTGFSTAKLNSHVNFQYTASSGDVVTSANWFGRADGGGNDTIWVGLYNITTDSILVDSFRIVPADTDTMWHQSETVSIALIADSVYCLALGQEKGAMQYWRGTLSNGMQNSASNDLEASWVGTGTFGSHMLLYATYTPGGGASVSQMMTIINTE